MSNLDKLTKCFHEALAIPRELSVRDLSYNKSPSWDSVAHMRLVAAIETNFSIMFTTDQILDMNNFDKARETVEAHGISFKS